MTVDNAQLLPGTRRLFAPHQLLLSALALTLNCMATHGAAHVRSSYGDSTADAAQQLLPSAGGGIEMTAVALDPFKGSGVARRRAHLLQRLQSLDPGNQGITDKQQLVSVLAWLHVVVCFSQTRCTR